MSYIYRPGWRPSGLWLRFCSWRRDRARRAEAKWANRGYWLDPEWRRKAR